VTPDGHRLRRVQKMSVGFAGKEDQGDFGGLRTRLRKMNDQELLRLGLASKSILDLKRTSVVLCLNFQQFLHRSSGWQLGLVS
jgi:hypothetical protein